jgi:DNA-binding IclR family transcriptional regulator
MALAEKLPSVDNDYRNQATARVLAVLLAFVGRNQPRGVSELARELGMNKNMVHRALATLASDGYIARDESGSRYQLGPRLFALGATVSGESDIVVLARPVLEQFHALTGESIYLSIIVGRNRVTVDDILAQGPRVLRSARGHAVPLHCTKMSRVLLAHLSDADIRAYLYAARPLARQQRFPDPPSETARGTWEDILDIRATPYVLWRNPLLPRAAYAIFPILDQAGRPHAIVTVGGPAERFDLPKVAALAPRMQAILEPLQREARLFAAPPFTRKG